MHSHSLVPHDLAVRSRHSSSGFLSCSKASYLDFESATERGRATVQRPTILRTEAGLVNLPQRVEPSDEAVSLIGGDASPRVG